MKHMARSSRSGQVLLITVMVLAVSLSIGLVAIFNARTGTQTSKLEDDSQRALAAAEAGVRAALQNNSQQTMGTGSLSSFSGITGGATIATSGSSNSFTSPSLIQDEQYTFYMGTYTSGTPPVFGTSTAENVVLCFATGATIPALDIALIKGNSTTNTIIRHAVDPQGRIANATSGTSGCASTSGDASQFGRSYTIPASDIGTDTKLILVKTLYASTKLHFYRASTSFPSQGYNITSEATTQTSVTKKVQVFKTYPQIPADLFGIVW